MKHWRKFGIVSHCLPVCTDLYRKQLQICSSSSYVWQCVYCSLLVCMLMWNMAVLGDPILPACNNHNTCPACLYITVHIVTPLFKSECVNFSVTPVLHAVYDCYVIDTFVPAGIIG